ncbi:uncharacterized protein LAESUDRAFT_726475 [Laetiporus sulphureus 93-53]|uniref:Uncharacterized protein n=1 Tax=Laetiporus sulphureus 93-53 TaxID=1314785 RepID=A0A165DYP4_9APHY|nr:uncharacterized protein LAESUDRAFT_726475 [Laetiporus sulphureus 93-53]KZT05900.1 hypothetical protein LAESUDRAFT_726475 [Laetiporus sulphureus 93-53]
MKARCCRAHGRTGVITLTERRILTGKSRRLSKGAWMHSGIKKIEPPGRDLDKRWRRAPFHDPIAMISVMIAMIVP